MKTTLFTILGSLAIAAAGHAEMDQQIVQGKFVFTNDSDRKFATADLACRDWVTRSWADYKGTFVRSADLGEGNYRCYWKQPDGQQNDGAAVYKKVSCPDHSRTLMGAAWNDLSCECEDKRIAKAGQCVDPTETPATDAEPSSTKKNGCTFKQKSAGGGHEMSNQFCAFVSKNSPSYMVTVDKYEGTNPKGGKGTQATAAKANLETEIDALRGDVWYECKCGYAGIAEASSRTPSIVNGSAQDPNGKSVTKKGTSAKKQSFGLDEQILRQQRTAADCQLSYHLVVSNDKARAFFQERYPSAKVEVVAFPGCE